MNKLYRYILIIGLILIFASDEGFSQKAAQKATRIQVEYFKNYNETESLFVKLRVREERYVPFGNELVQVYSIGDTSNILLDKIRTNDLGEAIYIIQDDPKIFKDSLGLMAFEVEYKGTASIKSAKRKITVKQANLDISFFQKDTIKSIEVAVNEIGSDDQYQPINDLEIKLYIQGTFSQLIFAEEKTDENGKINLKFPVHMPGDTSGVLTIIAKVVEDDTYGTIESKGVMNWGISVPLAKQKQRGLGDTDAPLWMVYTLIILLSAVWFHYMYVIFLVIKIKLKGKSFKRKMSQQSSISLTDIDPT